MVLTVRQHGDGALLTGDTFDVRDVLKSHGGRWNSEAKGWFFKREAEVLKALTQKQLLVQDERPSCGVRKPIEKLTSTDGIICTPAPVRARARSRTPPATSKPKNAVLPEVRLNDRTVRERSASLVVAARQGAGEVSFPRFDTAASTASPSQEATARRLAEELVAVTSTIATGASDTSAVASVEAILDRADCFEASTLESSGLVREAARIAFLRGAGAAPLRRVGQRAWRRWLARRAEAAAAEEAIMLLKLPMST